ncbi:extracellular solute-binding protein [Patescibacteria group bacterium]|nr:extracellular solute-binding protein [Patescibacteria group bacterium]MCG2694651.1 extracellular solute-binding protein [Candidatus Parcubacteria bacterium]
MTNFQITILGFFTFFILVGIVLFAGFKGGGQSTIVGSVNIWGTVDKIIVDKLIRDLAVEDKTLKDVKYREITKISFDAELVEALASGNGPDVFILSQDSILKHQNKILTVPYESYPARDFKNNFIEEGELYLNDTGVLGLPFIVNPLVMYWNRDIFSENSIANPPKTWEEFFSLSGKITEIDESLNILTSLVAFGEFSNLIHAKDIISTLIIQAGSPIISKEGVVLKKADGSIIPAEEAVDFFVQFSNPTKKSVYTWNRSLPDSQKSFLAGNLAVYFGYASELGELRAKNPNLNFDVAVFPQATKGTSATFGRMNALVISKNSKNIAGAFEVIKKLTSENSLSILSGYTELPPVLRNLLAKKPADNPYLGVFYDSALISKAWFDPNPQETDNIFQEMVESIVSGRRTVKNAISATDSELNELIQ